MNPKYAFHLTTVIGILYACYGLLEPADWIPFAVGVSVACVGVIGADLLRWMESNTRERHNDDRDLG